MNRSLWHSTTGKLFLGGCGTQLGLMTACGSLAALLVFCAVCGFTNALTIGVAQEVTILPTTPTATTTVLPTPTSAVLESLLGQVRLLNSEVSFLRSNTQVAAAPPTITPTPTATPIPFAVAMQSGVNLRSGPSPDYTRVGVLPQGESVQIVGRNDISSWWLITLGDGTFAWVSADLVNSHYLNEAIPIVTIPSLLVWGTPGAAGSVSNGGAEASIVSTPGALPAEGQLTPREVVPQGTPTASAGIQRTYVEDMPAYKRLLGHLLVPPSSASVSPHGDQIALTERIKLYTLTTDGALSTVWLEDTADVGPIDNIVWSPDGDFMALTIGFKEQYCKPCEGVAVIRIADGRLTYLENPGELDLRAPRWTQDGKIIVTAHPGEPASGTAYIYDVSGRGEPAQGTYVLSASHQGQKWFPWQPGKTWLVGSTERADSYNAD